MEGLKAAKGFKDRADELAPQIEALNKEIGSSDRKFFLHITFFTIPYHRGVTLPFHPFST